MFKARTLALACAAAFASQSGLALAHDSKTDQQLKAQINALQQQLDALKSSLNQVQTQQADTQAQVQTVQAQESAAPKGGSFLERKSGTDKLTFLTNGGEITLYGNLNLSVDDTTKGLSGKTANGVGPVGNMGWQPGISSNLSYFGLKGFQDVDLGLTKFVYQLETQIDVSATSGTGSNNASDSNTVKGGLTSRNSFIGLASPAWGAVKIGKTDAPYKTSTGRMNPFSGMLGDYDVIMGNTGGDNRVEFATRLDHAIWYESPNMSGFTFNALISPGQNRASDNDNIAGGESDCTGGNAPYSGGVTGCTDGSFGSVYSADVAYTHGPLYVTAAYELHRDVNRTSDLGLAENDPSDIANETAAKVGAQYKFRTGTTVSAIYEHMARGVAPALDYQNERQRSGTWLAISQKLTPKDVMSFGWAHAGKSEGILSTHDNDNSAATGLPGSGYGDNSANMYTLALVHHVDKNLSFYADYATTFNGSAAHYDLGAGGRGLTTDCHDAGVAPLSASGNANYSEGADCWAGGHEQGVSVGLQYKF